MKSFKCIVVGAGGISGVWFPHLKTENVGVAAIVDLRADAAEAAKQKYALEGAIIETSLAAALRNVEADFVLDLTVPAAHANVTIQALKAGLHVVGEKPMASSMAEARRMVATARKTGRMYMVSQSRRWKPTTLGVAGAVRGGQLGPVTTVNCDFFIGAHFGGFRDEMASPLILDMAIHHFDLARMFCGADPVSVYAEEFNPAGSWYAGAAAGNCIFEMTNGIRFAYRGSWCAEGCHTGWDGDWRVIGEKGTLLYTADKTITGEVVSGTTGFHREKKPLDVALPAVPASGMHGALREMLAFLSNGTQPQTECHDNIKSLAMVFAAIESSKKGRRVSVKSL